MKLLFCGTPEFAVPTLRRLHGEKFEIAAVVTQPDRPKGRGLESAASPVKAAALELGLRVEQPEKLKGEAGRALLEHYQPEAVVIVGYGQIIPADLLDIPKHGWINLHASLLPKYRGAAPVQWALINGETSTGVTTMRIDAGLDTGPIFLQREVQIGDEDNAVTLAARLAEVGAETMVETLRGIAAGTLAPQPQDNSKASKAPLLKKEHGRLDWSQPARAVFNRIRGLVPWPGAYTSFRGQLVHIWRASLVAPEGVAQAPAPGTVLVEKHALYAACGDDGWLGLDELQPANRKRLAATDFINGLHVRTGERFGS
ncbi:MAG TPA: methionyl-tRNA formyltransferase [Candidatus Xenobia bacterium]|nr:methionyl-tRNA formyltransferase [Candidatus Xenobia bacterium]